MPLELPELWIEIPAAGRRVLVYQRGAGGLSVLAFACCPCLELELVRDRYPGALVIDWRPVPASVFLYSPRPYHFGRYVLAAAECGALVLCCLPR